MRAIHSSPRNGEVRLPTDHVIEVLKHHWAKPPISTCERTRRTFAARQAFWISLLGGVARVFGDEGVEIPNHTARPSLWVQEAESGSGFGRRGAGNVEEDREAHAAVGDRRCDVTDFIDHPGTEHRAVELSTAQEYQFEQTKTFAELANGNAQVHFTFAAKEIGDAGGMEVRLLIVTDAISDQQDNTVAVHFIFPEAQNAFRVHTDVITTSNPDCPKICARAGN